MKIRIYITLGVVLLICSLVGCNLPTPEAQLTSAPQVDSSADIETQPAPTSEPEPSGPKDCGEDFDCFINAAASCEPATVIWTYDLSLFGPTTRTVLYQEIKGLDGDRCVYYQRTDSVEVFFSDEVKQQMLDNGLTEEQIEEQRSMAEDAAQQAGYDDTCLFPPDELAGMLTRWQQGTFSMDDYQAAECSGKIFGE